MSIQRGVARTVTFGSLNTDGTANTATTPTVVVDKDAGGQTGATNPPSHQGNGSWKIALTAAEMTADLVSLTAYGAGLRPEYREFYTEAGGVVVDANIVGVDPLLAFGPSGVVNANVVSVDPVLASGSGGVVDANVVSVDPVLASGSGGVVDARVVGFATDTTLPPVTLTAAGLDAVIVEAGVNARQALSPILAAACGVLLGAGSGTIVLRGGNVSTTRITATCDNLGNRTSVTLALPA